jgi:glycosyltransferase involved in cell wall biosynthesis
VIEGAYNNEIAANINCPYKQSEPYILYTGTLDQRYGICNLIDAFSSTGLNYNLVICGNGNESEKNYIIEKGESDKRIKYLGSLSYQDILFLQQNASLLINPRNNKEEFTKYSFPSKTMEYLASGTPTLIYKLDGIPEEYYEYCYYINGEDDSIDTLANTISEILTKSKDENKILGDRAKQFILKNKNGNAQALKIIEYIN